MIFENLFSGCPLDVTVATHMTKASTIAAFAASECESLFSVTRCLFSVAFVRCFAPVLHCSEAGAKAEIALHGLRH